MHIANLRPEYSAQAMCSPVNPLVEPAIHSLRELRPAVSFVADQGCGKLRHLRLLLSYFRKVILVDTEYQLARTMSIDGLIGAVPDYVRQMPMTERRRVQVVPATHFEAAKCDLDAVFSICTFDVVPSSTRIELAQSAHRNLKPGGVFVVITPRNDSTILRRCGNHNRHQDGHAFQHHGVSTFYANFRDHAPLTRLVERKGFQLLHDMSRYRHVCLLFARTA